jgi:hypothetical protein
MRYLYYRNTRTSTHLYPSFTTTHRKENWIDNVTMSHKTKIVNLKKGLCQQQCHYYHPERYLTNCLH